MTTSEENVWFGMSYGFTPFPLTPTLNRPTHPKEEKENDAQASRTSRYTGSYPGVLLFSSLYHSTIIKHPSRIDSSHTFSITTHCMYCVYIHISKKINNVSLSLKIISLTIFVYHSSTRLNA